MSLNFEKSDIRNELLKYKYSTPGDLVINVETKEVYFVKITFGDQIKVTYDLNTNIAERAFQRESLKAVEKKYLSVDFIREYISGRRCKENLNILFEKYYREDKVKPFFYHLKSEEEVQKDLGLITTDHPDDIRPKYIERLRILREEYFAEIRKACEERKIPFELYQDF